MKIITIRIVAMDSHGFESRLHGFSPSGSILNSQGDLRLEDAQVRDGFQFGTWDPSCLLEALRHTPYSHVGVYAFFGVWNG